MAFIKMTVKTDLSGMVKYQTRMAKLLAHQANDDAAIAELDEKWMRRIRVFLAEHFRQASVGGADWPGHAESTIEARRRRLERMIAAIAESGEKYAKQKAGGVKGAHRRWSKARMAAGGSEFKILDETHVIHDAVTTLDDSSSIIHEPKPLLGEGLTISGGGTHGDSGLTTAELASFHQRGNSRLPQRQIVVPISDEVWQEMLHDLRETVMRITEETAIHH